MDFFSEFFKIKDNTFLFYIKDVAFWKFFAQKEKKKLTPNIISKQFFDFLIGCKGLAGTKLGLDEDLTPTQQARKSKLWPLFKEAKATGKRAFWRTVELFVDSTQICPPSSI